MNNILFACDIDNTLIYSKKHPHFDWPCVERIHSVEQAYMSLKTMDNLRKVSQEADFVPITTRSVEQYRRISFPEDIKIPFAVVANGAKCLLDGTINAQELLAHTAEQKAEIERMYNALFDSERYIRCRIVDDAYCFVYCDKTIEPSTEADRLSRETTLRVIASGKKIYLLPPDLHKGSALDAIREKNPYALCIAAGDSDMDIPMLERADYAIMPENIAHLWNGSGNSVIADNTLPFSDFVTQKALEIIHNFKQKL